MALLDHGRVGWPGVDTGLVVFTGSGPGSDGRVPAHAVSPTTHDYLYAYLDACADGDTAPADTPTPTPIPLPTDTPRPPRFHTVESGETLFGLSLLYRISAESIAEANGFGMDSPIQLGESLNIPGRRLRLRWNP
ncbi:MAG: LysM domain-containing protein [Chloroflexota bacterium]